MGAAAIPSWVNRLWAFVRREWPLCVLTVLTLWLVLCSYETAPLRIMSLLGLAGSLFCLKRFGLDQCPWMYLLAVALMLPLFFAVAGANELPAIAPLWSWDWWFAVQLLGSVLGVLVAIPCSLFFLRDTRGFSALWKIPLCIFFLILAVGPFFWGLGIIIVLSFVSCP